MVVKEDWVTAAMTDDALVVELLARLKEARAVPGSSKAAASPAKAAAELPPPRWGIRQPRTRLAFRCDTASPVKGGDLRRNSPTTPLSWSAGTASSSGTADGYEESDLPACGSSRSKVISTNDSTSSLNKKLKRKKTFADLKEEENFLLKERSHLNKELASLNATYKDEWARNESLKKMKIDFSSHPTKIIAHAAADRYNRSTRNAQHTRIAMSYPNYDPLKLLPQAGIRNYPPSDAYQDPVPAPKQEAPAPFVLPDLNLMPTEDDFCS